MSRVVVDDYEITKDVLAPGDDGYGNLPSVPERDPSEDTPGLSGAPGFTSEVLMPGQRPDMADDPHSDPADRRSGDSRVDDLVGSGHGFIVKKSGAPTRDIPPCRYCGNPMYSHVAWICECSMLVVRLVGDDGKCKCNWCLINRNALPGPGRPKTQCGRPECKKAHKRSQNRRNYHRRRKQLASAV